MKLKLKSLMDNACKSENSLGGYIKKQKGTTFAKKNAP